MNTERPDDQIVVVSGTADPDPDCLHCALVPFMNQWLRDHPQKVDAGAMMDVAVFLGELFGSLVYRQEAHMHDLAHVFNAIKGSATELLETLKRTPPEHH